MWLAWIPVSAAFTGDDIMAALEATAEHRKLQLMPEHAVAIPESAYRAVAKGKVEAGLVSREGYKSKQAWGVAVVDVSIGAFYGAANDDQSKPRYNKTSFAEVIEGGQCGQGRKTFMYLPLTMLSDRYWVVEFTKNDTLREATGGRVRQVVWDSVDPVIPAGKRANDYIASGGIPIEFAKGAWYLTALDDSHTLVEYWTWTDPGGYVPAGIASSFAAGGVKDTIAATVKLAKDGPRCGTD